MKKKIVMKKYAPTNEDLKEILEHMIGEYGRTHQPEIETKWRDYGNELVQWLNERFENRMAGVAFLDFMMFTQREELRRVISADFRVV